VLITIDAGGLEPTTTDLSAAQIAPIPLFSSLSPNALRSLIEAVTVREIAAGELVVREGTAGDTLYVIVEGQMRVFHEGLAASAAPLATLTDGAFFGEIALLGDVKRTASVAATTPTTLLEISREVAYRLIDTHPPVLLELLRFFRERLVDNLIAESPIFAPFGGDERLALAERFAFIETDPGYTIQRAGVPADALHVFLCGAARRG
jgi:CRP-like cAMP-binding protein